MEPVREPLHPHRAEKGCNDYRVQRPAPMVANHVPDNRQGQDGFDESGILVLVNERAERAGIRRRIEDPKCLARRRSEEGKDRNHRQDAGEDQGRAQKTLPLAEAVAIQIRGQQEGASGLVTRFSVASSVVASIDGPSHGRLATHPTPPAATTIHPAKCRLTDRHLHDPDRRESEQRNSEKRSAPSGPALHSVRIPKPRITASTMSGR